MRISDWSSDVCSSDLPRTALQVHLFPHAGIIEQRKVRLDLPVYGYPEGAQRSRVDVHFHDDLGRGLAYIANAVSGASELSHQLSVGRLHHERSEEHTSELQSLMRISYAVFCLKKNKDINIP